MGQTNSESIGATPWRSMLHCGTPDTRHGGGCCIAVWWIYQGGEEGSSGTVSCLFSLGSLNPPFSYPPHMQTHKHTCRNIWVLMKICCTWCSCCEQFLEEKDIASMFIVYNHPFLSHLSCCCYLLILFSWLPFPLPRCLCYEIYISILLRIPICKLLIKSCASVAKSGRIIITYYLL